MKKFLFVLLLLPIIGFSQKYVQFGGKLIKLNDDFTWEYIKLEVAQDIISVDNDSDINEVPLSIVETVPLFPGCSESASDREQRECFQQKIQEHIAVNFSYPEIAQEMGIQGRVFVQFTINKSGFITDLQTRGPDKNLEIEANRIIGLLPRIKPGKQKGKPVNVPFSIPITFKLD